MSGINVNTVMSQMNTGQYDFSVAVSGERSDFRQYLFDRTAIKRRSDFRDNTVRATTSATVLDFDKCPMPFTKGIDSLRQFRDAELPQKVGYLFFVGNDLRHAIDFEHRIGMVCCDTTHNNDFGNGIFADESSYFLPAFRFAFCRNGTGIDDNNISKITFFGFDVTVPQESATDELRLVLINLATESVKVKKHENSPANKTLVK
jgi:hypothetical protein